MLVREANFSILIQIFVSFSYVFSLTINKKLNSYFNIFS